MTTDVSAIELLLAQRLQSTAKRGTSIPRRPSHAEPIPLSGAQHRFWLLQQLHPDQTANRPLLVRLTGSLDEQALTESVNEIVRRHEILRTVYRQGIESEPVQVVTPWRRLEIERLPLPAAAIGDDDALAAFVAGHTGQVFDLERGPIMHAKLLRAGPELTFLLVDFHHIAFDGWSAANFVRELATHYAAFDGGRPPALPEPPIQYADYALWQQQRLQTGGDPAKPHTGWSRLQQLTQLAAEDLAYWERQLKGAIPYPGLRQDFSPGQPSDRGDAHTPAWGQRLLLAPMETERLEALSRAEGVTLFTTLLTALQVLLWRYSDRSTGRQADDIPIAVIVAGRTQPECEDLIGCFINHLIIRGQLSGQPSFRRLLAQTSETVLAALDHQETPIQSVIEHLGLTRTGGSNAATFRDVTFQLRNMPLVEALNTPGESGRPGLKFEVVQLPPRAAIDDLMFDALRTPSGLLLEASYDVKRFRPTTIARVLASYRTLLEAIVADPNQPISRLPLLDVSERRGILVDWNQTARPYPRLPALAQLFEHQVERSPQAIAIESAEPGSDALTYAELNRRSNQLASYLRSRINPNTGQEPLIGLCLERGIDAVSAILAILKAGAAYLPLSPDLPEARLAFLIADASAGLILTKSRFIPRLPPTGPTCICLDEIGDDLAREPEGNLPPIATGQSLAYTLYTSGSTGQPKGVLIEQHSITNLALGQIEAFRIQPESRVLQFAPLSFDASVSEIFIALLCGATLVLPGPDAVLFGPPLQELLDHCAITTVTLPPSVLATLPDAPLPHLQTLISAGERLPAELAARWQHGAGLRLLNAYGPTEAAVCAAIGDATASGATGQPAIGKPFANTQAFVLDAHLQPVPIGVPAELYLGGVGLGRGYANRPDLTAAAFIPNPFFPFQPAETASQRLYRTGDLACWRENGELEFLGRVDHQVKIRGFRVEIEEIEAALRQHPGLSDAAIVVDESDPADKRLVAFIMRPDGTGTTPDLRRFLASRLPDFMIPSRFHELAALPLTPHGKLDRHALTALSSIEGSRPSPAAITPPRTPPEEQLAAIWRDLLGVDEISVFDSFLDLGGHSLLLTRLAARIETEFGVRLPLRYLFDNPTLDEMIGQILTKQIEAADPLAVEQMLAELAQLSPDEIAQLLQSA